jgi:arginine decarboxylase
MPIHYLHTKPDRKAVLSDITCDSEGKIDRFVTSKGVSDTLALHTPREDEDYILGVFLVGAYQETLGDLHNLFGDTNVVSITYEDGSFSYVEYEPKRLEAMIRTKAEKAVQEGRITVQERRKIISAYTAGLRGYTYYETDQEE